MVKSMWSVLQSMEDMGRDMENAVDIYLRFATEASEKLVRLEAALLVGDNSGHAVHQTRFGLLVESQRIVRQHTGKQSWKAELESRAAVWFSSLYANFYLSPSLHLIIDFLSICLPIISTLSFFDFFFCFDVSCLISFFMLGYESSWL